MKRPYKNDVTVTHYSEFQGRVVTQIMSLQHAREHFSRLTEVQKSCYSIRCTEPADYDTAAER